MAIQTASAEGSTAAGASRSNNAHFYHPELDALRFFAFLMIFVHHSMPHEPSFYTAMGVPGTVAVVLAGLGATGAYGVDIFFVLSSYLITELLLRETARFGRVDLKAFYVRRALRIWPLYLVFMGIAVALQRFFPGQRVGWGAGLAFTFLAGNWWIVFKGFPSSVIFPLWCVSIEEQFYLFWPFVMRKLGKRGLLIAVGVLFAIANLTRLYLGLQHTWETPIWCNTFVWFDAIGAGILLAILLRGEAPRLHWLPRVALLAGGLTCLVLGGNYFAIKRDPLTLERLMLGYPVVLVGAVALVLAVLHDSASHRKFNPFVYLGRISFGLYVFHVLGLMISDYTIQNHKMSLGRYLWRNSFALAVTILMAIASFHLLESPFLKMKKRFTRIASGG